MVFLDLACASGVSAGGNSRAFRAVWGKSLPFPRRPGGTPDSDRQGSGPPSLTIPGHRSMALWGWKPTDQANADTGPAIQHAIFMLIASPRPPVRCDSAAHS